MNKRAYQQFDPLRTRARAENASLKDRGAAASNGVDQKTIETLKAARDQVMQAEKIVGKNMDLEGGENPGPRQMYDKPDQLEIQNVQPKEQKLSKDIADNFLTEFAEEFVQKLAAIEREKAAVDEEMTKVENLWSSLTEKKKILEQRKNELIRLKDRLKELDKEMNNALKSQLI